MIEIIKEYSFGFILLYDMVKRKIIMINVHA